MRFRVSRLILAASAIALAAVAPGRVHAAPPAITVENIRAGFGDAFKVGAWTPVWVDLKAGPARFSGVLEATVPDDDGTSTTARRPVALEANGFATFVTYVRPGARNSPLIVRVFDDTGRPKTPAVDAEELNKKSFNDLDPGQGLVLTMGTVAGVDEIPALAGFTGVNNAAPDMVVAKVGKAGGIPGRWYGYDSAEAVVIDTNDREVLDALDAGRGGALVEWVRNGGHLVLAGTANWQRLREGALKDVLPATPTGTTRLNDLGAIETFAGSGNNPIGKAMSALVLEGAEARGARALVTSASTTPVVRGPYGFGRVTLVGLDVDQKPFTDWKDRALFWVKALDLHGRGNEAAQAGAGAAPPGALVQNNVSDLATLLHRGLEEFQGVTLVPFGWVAFFVFLYILLIGPGDYFFLKKVVKRMELTWITFPTIVIVVSLIAYGAAYAIKGTDLRVNKVDLVEIDQTSNLVRGTSWATIFSPQNRDYTIGVAPLALDKAAPKPGDPPPPRRAGVETLVSCFGTPDPRFGNGNPARLSLTGAGYDYGPVGEAEELEGVRVPIWSTKSIVGRWSSPAGPALVSADLTPVGSDRLAGSITNTGSRPLKNVSLFFGKQVYDRIGTIAPGATVRIDAASRTRPVSGYIGELYGKIASFTNIYNNYYYNNNEQAQTLPRNETLQVMMFRDTLGGRSAAAPSVPFHALDLTGQLALDRPMLVAEVDGPAAALRLTGGSVVPKIEQLTLLRIILPLGKAADEGGPAEKPK